jgi:hypothetical protein
MIGRRNNALDAALDEAARMLTTAEPARVRVTALSDGVIRSRVPSWWLEVLEAPAALAGGLVAEQWERVVPGKMPKLKTMLRSQAIGSGLVERGEDLALVTAFVPATEFAGSWSAGFLPVDPTLPLPDFWDRFPAELQRFYTGLHDGFGHLHQEDGPSSLDYVLPESRIGLSVDDYFFNESDGPVPQLENLLQICAHVSDRLCVDIETGLTWEITSDPEEDGTHVVDLWSRLDDYCVWEVR